MAGLNLFTNNAATTLASSILSGATSLTVAAGTGNLFPTISGSQYFYCTLANAGGTVEVVKVTARSTDTFTVVRGQDGTSAVAWNSGDKFELRLVRADLLNFPQLDSDNTFAGLQTFSNTGVFSIGTNQFYKDASGNVGIGTASPQIPLDVVANTSSQAIRIRGRASDNLCSYIFDNNTGSAAGNVSYIQGLASASGYLAFATINTERMRITANGGISFGGASNYGTSGQVLQSNGDAAPTWVTFNTLGGATETTTSSDVTLTSSSTRVQKAIQSGTSKSFIMPDATTFSAAGSPIYDLGTAGNSMYLKYSDGYKFGSIVAGTSGAKIGLSNITNSQTGYSVNNIYPSVKESDFTTVLANEFSLNLNGKVEFISVDTLDTNKYIIGYVNETTGIAYAVVATQSGTSFSLGTPLSILTGITSSVGPIQVIALSTTTAIIAVNSGGASNAYGLTISGTTITSSVSSSLDSNTTGFGRGFKLTSTTALFVITSTTTGSTCKWRVAQHNGASAVTYGTAVGSSSNINSGYGPITCLLSSTKFVTLYAVSTTDRSMLGRCGTISGLTITMGTEVTVNTFNNKAPNQYPSQYLGILAYSATEAFYLTDKGTGYLTVSGTTITPVSYSNTSPTGLTYNLIQMSSTTLLSNQAVVTYSGSGSYTIKPTSYVGQGVSNGGGAIVSGSTTSIINCGGAASTNYISIWLNSII